MSDEDKEKKPKAIEGAEQPIEKFHIPTFIRSMLEPYVNVAGNQQRKFKQTLEETLLRPMFRPRSKELEAIGKVCTTWAVMERVMGMTISRLAMAPEFPALALTKELTANNRIKVLKMLLPLHRERYQTKLANDAILKELSSLPAKIQTLKDRRNEIAHTVWLCSVGDGGGVAAIDSRPLSSSAAAAKKESDYIYTLQEINDLADEIQKMADHLFVLTQLLPAVDEPQHVQQLAQSVESLHREILPKRPRQPEPPPETK